jgi:hypothetical protein
VLPKETYFGKVEVQTLIKFNGYISFSSCAIFYLPVPAAGAGHGPTTLGRRGECSAIVVLSMTMHKASLIS